MVDTVSVPSPATEVDEAARNEAALKAAADAGVVVNGEAVTAPEPKPEVVERPENVPEKFWNAEKGEINVEAVLASNAELEKQFTKQKQESKKDEKPAEEKPTEGDQVSPVLTAREYYDEHGELSDEHYEALAKVGLDREYVDSYIQGQEAIAQTVYQHAYSLAGGSQESFEAMNAWAAENLSQEELAAHNAMVVNDETSDFAITQLYTRYLAERPNETPLISGETGAASGGDFFRSSTEMQQAMSDPRYSKDEAYRKEVERKIANADRAGVNLFT